MGESQHKKHNSRHVFKVTNTEAALQAGVFLFRCVQKISSKFTGEHPCRSVVSVKLQSRSVVSVKLQSNFTEITLRHGCSPVNFEESSAGLLLPIKASEPSYQ